MSKRKLTTTTTTKAEVATRRGSRQLAINSLFSPAAYAVAKNPIAAPVGVSISSTEETSDELWTEQHRPTSVHKLLGNSDRWSSLHQWFDQRARRVPNIVTVVLLVGPPGVGKTTAIHCLADEFKIPVTEFNLSSDHSADHINITVVKLLIDARPQVVALEEVDGASVACLKALEGLLPRTNTPASREAAKQRLQRTIEDTAVAQTSTTSANSSRMEGWAQLNLLLLTANKLTAAVARIAKWCLVIELQPLPVFHLQSLAEQVLVRHGAAHAVSAATLTSWVRDARGDARALINHIQFGLDGGGDRQCQPSLPDSNGLIDSRAFTTTSMSMQGAMASLLRPNSFRATSLRVEDRHSMDWCDDFVQTVPTAIDWCFQNYLVSDPRQGGQQSQRRRKGGKAAPIVPPGLRHLRALSTMQSQQKRRRQNAAPTSARTHCPLILTDIVHLADVFSDADCLASSANRREQRHVGRTVSLFRLHSYIAAAASTRHEANSQSLPLFLPPSPSMHLFATHPDAALVSNFASTDDAAAAMVASQRRYAGRLVDLALLEENVHCLRFNESSSSSSSSSPSECMWCLAGFDHGSPLAAELTRFRKSMLVSSVDISHKVKRSINHGY